MDLKLTGKTALITGASKGIGLACAQQLAAAGCNLRLAARTLADLEQVRQQLQAAYQVQVAVFAVDLADGAQARALLQRNQDIDFLVNNAGAIPSGSLTQIDEARWRAAWDLKVFGYINTCREAYAFMSERGHGVILNIIGAGGERPTASYIVGGAGNAALMAMTRALGANSLTRGVRVLAINPGLIHTERLEQVLRQAAQRRWQDAERWQELLSARHPPGEPAQIGAMAAFLLSDLSAFTTGTVITVDGGASARFAE